MSATLTWYNSGLGTKTGTAVGNYFTDYKTLFDSKAADPNFSWEVAASSLAGTPYYLWLRPKSGAVGRILLVCWTTNPAGNNAAILQSTPQTGSSVVYIAYFPNGNAASPSNLTAASGTISGDDTNCTMVSSVGVLATIYAASTVPYYFDSAEGLVLCTQNPASSTCYVNFVGELAVDSNDVAYPLSFGSNATGANAFGGTGLAVYSATGYSAGGSGQVGAKSSYSSQALLPGSIYPTWFPATLPNGWNLQSIGVTDILTDTTNTDAWFVSCPLVCCGTKGGGFPLKLRQIAYGPAYLGQFSVYNTTGPVVAARNVQAAISGSNGAPWLTNFKI